MLVLKILSTVFVSISYITMGLKNVFATGEKYKGVNMKKYIFWCVYGVCWRTLVIATLWLI